MPISKTEPLIRLVLSLTKAEKRNFRLYARKIQQEGELKFLQLFDLLEKNSQLPENILLDRLKIDTQSQFSSLKRHLYQHLLTSLRLLYNHKSLDIQIRELTDFAVILYGKSLYLEALQLLNKGKQLARKSHKDHLHLEIVEFEKRIESRHITRSSTERIHELTDEAHSRKKVIANVTDLSNLKLRLQRLFINHGHAKNEADRERIKHFFYNELPSNLLDQPTFFERIYLNQSYFWLHYCMLDFDKCFYYANEWVELFKKEPNMILKDVEIYMRGLHYLLIIAFCTKNQAVFETTHEDLRNCDQFLKIDWTQISKTQFSLFKIKAKLNYYLLSGHIGEGIQKVPAIQKNLNRISDKIDPHKTMIIHYKIACLYISNGQFDSGIDFLNIIINHPGKHLRDDLEVYTRLLLILAHYQLGNEAVVDYLLSTTSRFFLKLNDLTQTPKAILQFFKKITQLDPRRAKEEMQNSMQKFNTLAHDPYEKRAFVFLDIRSWLQSLLEQRSIAEIIAEKVFI